ncbi:hypothetical protein [Globicatella sanguinis]
MSGLNLRLSTCLRPTQLCGGRPTKRKSFDFLLLVHSQSLPSFFNALFI